MFFRGSVRISALGCQFCSSRFQVQDSSFMLWALVFRVRASVHEVWGLGFRVWV